MKKFHKLITLLMIFGLFTACTGREIQTDAEITILKTEYTVGGEQDSEVMATFSVNVDWTTSAISYAGDSKDWLEVTPRGKAGTDQTITMRAKENSTGVERTASFNINYGGKEQKLTVSQKIKERSDITASFDPGFAAKLQERGYIPDATKILFSEVKSITSIDIEGTGENDVTSLAGIEHFEALRELNFAANQVSTVDFSKNVALVSLECSYNQLSALDFSKNVALASLICTKNQLSTLDLSNNVALIYLICQNNKLSALDLSKNVALTHLACQNNKITSLDVSTNTALTGLLCGSNKLSALDLSKNTLIANLNCFDNQIATLNLGKNTALIVLHCLGNQLTSLDVTGVPNLAHLFCGANQISSLDITKNTVLAKFSCSKNKLTTLDVSNSPNLIQLFCYENKLTTLDVSNNPNLLNLDVRSNQLTSLDVSVNTSLTGLQLNDNPGEGTTFVVKSWFGNNEIPSDEFTKGDWVFNNVKITVDYQKAI